MSHPGDTPETAAERRPRRPGRIRAALLALTGAPVVPDQLRAEWAAWALELEAMCDKITAAANRLNTRHKRELDRALEKLDEYKRREQAGDPLMQADGPSSYSPMKRMLNRRLLAARGVSIPTNGGGYDVDESEGE